MIKTGRKATMPKIPIDRKVLDGLVTSEYLMELFHRKEASIFLWRKNRGLPHLEIPGDGRASIRYDLEEVVRWAKKYRIRTYAVDFESVEVETEHEREKVVA